MYAWKKWAAPLLRKNPTRFGEKAIRARGVAAPTAAMDAQKFLSRWNHSIGIFRTENKEYSEYSENY